MLNKNGAVEKVDSSADTYEYVGSNVFARGHVVIRFGDMLLTAEKAIINLESQDIELIGGISFAQRTTFPQLMTPETYADALKDPYRIVKKIDIVTTETGKKMIQVSVTKNTMYMKAERAFMNLKSGTIQFKDFLLKSGVLYASGQRAERAFDGTITVENARFTTCEYIIDGHDHYAISAKRAVLQPPRANSGIFNYSADQGDLSVWTVNSFIELWGVPVFWLPFLYKPPEEGAFGGRIEFGKDSDWGYYIRTSKTVQILDEPYLNANLHLDYYSERGLGYGINLDLLTPESATELFFYGISDQEPYNAWSNGHSSDAEWKKNNSRLAIPTYRYEFKLANLTHLTPRLDFRAQIDLLSDYNFLDDYFTRRYNEELEPPTFIDLERQFDRLTASLYTTFRVNDFFTSVEHLPMFRLDFQRQELFGGLYYQGETTLGYMEMKWRNFDRERIYGNLVENKDYSSLRFDTLHMFYYPLQFANLNFIPRAGFRLTAYSDSSKQKIDSDALNNMFLNDYVDGQPTVDVVNYDKKGGSRVRFAGEIGFELNTKFYRSWQNVKSEYLGLDGLRHVIVPYINYTFIPQTTQDPDRLYYFDDIDRIDEQHFVRLGLVNRLQTRRDGRIYEWFSMENYWDYFFHTAEGFNHIGDFGTIVRFRPTENFTLTTELLLDLGQSNSHDGKVWRGNREAGRPGLSSKFFNRWYTHFSWKFAPGWRFYGGYTYSDSYKQRSPYSMGTTLTAVNATSLFYSSFDRGQYLSAGLEFPVLFDKKMNGYVQFSYDVDAALMENVSLGLSRRFHCWRVTAEIGRECERGGENYDKRYTNYFAFFISLTAMPDVAIGRRLEP